MEARISAPVQTGPGAHLVSCTIGTEFLSLRVNWSGRRVNHLPQSSAEVEERLELTCIPPPGLHDLLYGKGYLCIHYV